jgi:hypothetical protein
LIVVVILRLILVSTGRNVLNSYESEITINPNDINRRRIEELEEVLTGYRQQVEQDFVNFQGKPSQTSLARAGKAEEMAVDPKPAVCAPR